MFGNTILISNFIVKAFKSICFLLDQAIFYFARTAYKVFYFMANVSLVNSDMIETFTARVYAILGLIMMFVLAFNLLNYIIDPEKVNDKQIGAVTFLKDVVIALVVITVLPQIFTMLYSVQNQILQSNVLANLILGGYTDSEGATDEGYERNKDKYKTKTAYYVDKGADTMVASVYVAFVTPKDDNFSALDCAKDDGTHDEYCDAYDDVVDTGSIEPFSKLINQDKYNYTPLISTAAGVVLLFFMLSYCLELAKRVGKLALLQLLAPIPFVMEILPYKKGTRKNWIDTTIKVFLDVFIFQATIYVIILLITFIPPAIVSVFASNPSAGGFVKTVVIVLLIFGLLQFGNEAPKMITDLFGLKSDGVLAAVSKRATAMAGVTGGLLSSTAGRGLRNAFATYKSTEGGGFKKTMSAIGSGFAGAGSGVARTLWGARNVHSFSDAMKQRKQVNKDLVTARVKRDAYQHAHGGFWGAMGGHIEDARDAVGRGFRGYVGTQDDYEKYKQIDKVNSEYKELYEEYVESIWKKDAKYQNYKIQYDEATRKGDAAAAEAARIQMHNARQAALQKNKTKLMEAAGRLNNFIDANQGIPGITTGRLDLQQALNDPQNYIRTIEDMVVGEHEASITRRDQNGNTIQTITTIRSAGPDGYKPQLTALANNGEYQEGKVQERLAADARAQTQRAADDASKGSGK